MKWIVITLPDFIENESTYINQLFKAGIDLLHLRKPESNIEECKRLIQEIDKKWHKKIVVHDHFELCQEFHLHGIHLNRRNHEIPEGFQGSISQSCHSFINEIAKQENITIDDSDKEALAKRYGYESLETMLQNDNIDQKMVDDTALMQKTLDFLVENAKITVSTEENNAALNTEAAEDEAE